MKFKTKFLIEEYELPWENTVEDEIIKKNRWSLTHRIVFQHEGKFYQTTYEEPSTENQDIGPWEYQDEVECPEVVAQLKTIKVWVPIDNTE